MSVYGGFPTRNHETVYNTVLFKLINILQFRVKLYSQGIISQNNDHSEILSQEGDLPSHEVNFMKLFK